MEKPIKINSLEKQVQFCLNMNCLGCYLNKGSYRDCPHFENKCKARETQDNK